MEREKEAGVKMRACIADVLKEAPDEISYDTMAGLILNVLRNPILQTIKDQHLLDPQEEKDKTYDIAIDHAYEAVAWIFDRTLK
jgi:hypothetical protein